MAIKRNQISKNVSLGGGGGSDILTQLTEAELGGLLPNTPNRILDSFDDDTKGVKVNCSVAADALTLDASETSGTYTRSKKVSIEAASVKGVAVMRLRAAAPSDGQTVPMTASSQAVVVAGDATSYFTDTKNVIIATQDTTDTPSEPVYQHLLNGNGQPAVLQLTSAVYAAGPDETTLTIANPDNLDLAMGLGTNDLLAQMRVFPFDYDMEAYADGSTWESLTLDEAAIHGSVVTLEAIGSGLGQISQSVAGDPSADDVHYAISPNKTYAIARTRQNTSGNDTWRWSYSKDGGLTWSDLGTRTMNQDINPNPPEKHYDHNGQLVVADNGKMFSLYRRLNDSSRQAMYGVEADLAAVTPTLRDVADSGALGVGPTTGRVLGDSAGDANGTIAADLTNLSYIAISSHQSQPHNYILWYKNSGNTEGDDSSPTYETRTAEDAIGTPIFTQPQQVFVTRTDDDNHRTHIVYRRNDNTLRYIKFDQTSGTTSTTLTHNIQLRSNGELAGSDLVGERLVAAFYTSGDLELARVDNVATGTPTYTGLTPFVDNSGGLQIDFREGITADTGTDNWFKVLGKRLRINPNDNNHVFFATTILHPYDGSGGHAHFYEILDITDYKGIQRFNYTQTSDAASMLDTSAREKNANAVTLAAGSRVRTYAQKMNQFGDIAEGAVVLKCEVFATSGGLPTGAALATSTNTIDFSKVTKSSGQWCYWNFDDSALESLTGEYAFVLENVGTQGGTPDGSNYPRMSFNSGDVDGNSRRSLFNGTIWTSDFGNDLVYEVHSEWVTDLGYPELKLGPNGEARADAETQIEWVEEAGSEETLMFTFRRIKDYSSTMRDLSGHPFRRLLTLGSGGAGDKKVTVGDLKGVGYQNETNGFDVDPNLRFNVSNGDTSARMQDTDTGAESAGQGRAQDRSGHNWEPNSGFDIDVADVDFDSGRCNDFNGTGNHFDYNTTSSQGDHLNLHTDEDFVIEWEFKADDFASSPHSNPRFLHKYTSGTNFWHVRMDTDGKIRLRVNNGSTFDTASTIGDFSTGTYYKARVVYDGSTRKAKIYKSTDGVTFTELTLSQDDTYPSGFAAGDGGNLNMARDATSGVNYFDGKMGYVKIARAPNGVMNLTQNTTAQGPFEYAGYKDQSPITSHQNMGSFIGGKKVQGRNHDSNLTTNYYVPWMSSPEEAGASSIVDAYDQQLYFEQGSLGASGSDLGLRVNLGRKSDDDDSSIQGVNFVYDKV